LPLRTVCFKHLAQKCTKPFQKMTTCFLISIPLSVFLMPVPPVVGPSLWEVPGTSAAQKRVAGFLLRCTHRKNDKRKFCEQRDNFTLYTFANNIKLNLRFITLLHVDSVGTCQTVILPALQW
jgi:hypothetical protein